MFIVADNGVARQNNECVGEQLPQASAALYYYFKVLGKGSKPNKLLLYEIW